jgi:tetratricopeptide (TPR) repeat protein
MTPDQNKFARAHIKHTVIPVLIALLTFGTILCPASVLAELSKSGEPTRSGNYSGPATQSTESINSELSSHVNSLTELIAREKYSEAAECAQMALELNSTKVGKDNASNAKFLNYLGWLEQKLGRMGDARSHFELAIKLCDNEIAQSTSALPQTGTNPNNEFSAGAELAIALNNLGTLLYTQGDYVSALSQFERALSVNEKLLQENDMKLAQNLKNLAGAMDACGRADAALQHYQRAIAIMEKQEKPADSELAQILDDYACSLEDKGRFDEALQLFEKALTLKEKVYGGDHLELASSLNNIGVLKMDTHKEGAEKFFDRAIAISEKSLGPDHIELVAEVDNRADFDFIQMNYGLAAKGYVRAAAIINRFFKNVLPYCSNAEKQALFDQYSHDQISRLLSVCKSGPMLSSAYEMILPWKGTLVNSESRVRKADLDSELREKANKLSQVRSELSAWYLEAGSTRSHWAERNAQLTREKEELERALSGALKTSHSDMNSSADSLVGFCSVLKEGEAFVDIYEFDQIGTKEGNLTRKLCSERSL